MRNENLFILICYTFAFVLLPFSTEVFMGAFWKNGDIMNLIVSASFFILIFTGWYLQLKKVWYILHPKVM